MVKNKSAWNCEEGKEIHLWQFAVAPTAKVTATVHGKCLVKMRKALNLYNKRKDHIHITSVIVKIVLSIFAINFLLCPI